jgi:hypothetical protein
LIKIKIKVHQDRGLETKPFPASQWLRIETTRKQLLSKVGDEGSALSLILDRQKEHIGTKPRVAGSATEENSNRKGKRERYSREKNWHKSICKKEI